MCTRTRFGLISAFVPISDVSLYDTSICCFEHQFFKLFSLFDANHKRRLSGLQLLLALVNRVGNQKMSSVHSNKQLIMEAIRTLLEISKSVNASFVTHPIVSYLSSSPQFLTKNQSLP